jgi:hypothetical protein
MDQVVAGGHPFARDRLGELSVEIRRNSPRQRDPHGCTRRFDLPQQLRAWSIPSGKLRGPIPDVSGPPQSGPKVVLHVPREVQDEGAGHVGDAGHLLPQPALVGIRLDLPAQRTEVSVENGGY